MGSSWRASPSVGRSRCRAEREPRRTGAGRAGGRKEAAAARPPAPPPRARRGSPLLVELGEAAGEISLRSSGAPAPPYREEHDRRRTGDRHRGHASRGLAGRRRAGRGPGQRRGARRVALRGLDAWLDGRRLDGGCARCGGGHAVRPVDPAGGSLRSSGPAGRPGAYGSGPGAGHAPATSTSSAPWRTCSTPGPLGQPSANSRPRRSRP